VPEAATSSDLGDRQAHSPTTVKKANTAQRLHDGDKRHLKMNDVVQSLRNSKKEKTMSTSFRKARHLYFETLENRVLPAVGALAVLPHTPGLVGNVAAIQARPAAAPPTSPNVLAVSKRAASAVLATLNANSTPTVQAGANASGLLALSTGSATSILTGPASIVASTVAIQVQAVLDSPSSFVNSLIEDVNDADSLIGILDAEPTTTWSETNSTPEEGLAFSSNNWLATMFNESNINA
jgi:ABC-type multidrug transport system fused ATPase/permease subunit